MNLHSWLAKTKHWPERNGERAKLIDFFWYFEYILQGGDGAKSCCSSSTYQFLHGAILYPGIQGLANDLVLRLDLLQEPPGISDLPRGLGAVMPARRCGEPLPHTRILHRGPVPV